MKQKTRKFLHNFFKIFIIFIIGIGLVNLGLYIGLKINHKKKLAQEAQYLVAPGNYVDINGHKVHVITGGDENSNKTLVFIHSDNVMDDSIALQPLFSKLENCRYVYIDRSGYGFSDTYGASKDTESIVNELKTALKESGVEGPYTLVALGSGGIQAFYWADKYPEDVNGIIGINMNYPEQFIEFETNQYCGFLDYLFVKLVGIGGHRLLKKSIFPKDTYGVYTVEQMNIRNALAGKYMYTWDMYGEERKTVDNAKETYEMGIPKNVDIYLIYNNPFLEPYLSTDEEALKAYNEAKEEGMDNDYADIFNYDVRDYFSSYSNVTVEDMAGPGRLYTYNPTELADMINQHIR